MRAVIKRTFGEQYTDASGKPAVFQYLEGAEVELPDEKYAILHKAGTVEPSPNLQWAISMGHSTDAELVVLRPRSHHKAKSTIPPDAEKYGGG